MSVNITADYPHHNDPARPTKVEVSIDDDTVQAMHTHTAVTPAPGIADLVCDILTHLGAPGPTRTDTDVEIVEYADRAVAVRVDGTEIARTNYDESGWAGMALLRSTATALAEATGLAITEIDGDAEDEANDDTPEG